jgi:membrane protein required for colicin V production
MDWLDVVVILVMVLPMYLGWRRGLIGTVVPLVGLVFAILMAGHFYDPVAEWLSHWLDSSGQAKLLGFAIIFVAVIAAAFAIAFAARRFLNFLLIGWVDTIGGLVFGLLAGTLIAGGLLSLVSKFFGSRVEGTVADSALATFLLDKFPFVLLLLPGEFDAVRDFFV